MKIYIPKWAVFLVISTWAAALCAHPVLGVAAVGRPETSLSFVSIALAVICPTVLFVLYWNRKLAQKVDKHKQESAENEERLQLIFEYSPDAVFVVEQSGHVVSANSRACELVKLSKNEVLKKTVYDLAPNEFHDDVKANLDQWFSGQLEQCEGVALVSDGTSIPIKMVGRTFQLENRQVLQLHARDITLRREAEERIHAARAMAEDSKDLAIHAYEVSEKASRSKSEFLANMSREIRTPLNDIIGLAGLLSGKNLTAEQKNYVKTIQQSSGGLLKIMNHVMDIAKMEAGQMDVQEEVIDLWELCKKLQQRFQPDADEKELKLICRCEETVPLYVVGDGALIEQVLEELLDNALHNTTEGMVALNIECHTTTPSGIGIYFQVVDTGAGIPIEKQASIFKKKIEATGSSRLFGGLGLAICKQQVELMGGVIGLTSKAGKGSDFHFSLSLPQAINPDSIKAMENNRARTVQKKNTRVLLVEDNKVNQKVGVALLNKIGCRVDAVDNGKYAVKKIRNENYDLVFMDCEMPVLDGFETTSEIRAMKEPGCSVPIIAITANAMKDDEQRCIAAGMDDYISKPVSREMLVKMINKHTAAA